MLSAIQSELLSKGTQQQLSEPLIFENWIPDLFKVVPNKLGQQRSTGGMIINFTAHNNSPYLQELLTLSKFSYVG